MPADDGAAFLQFAQDKEEEGLLYQRWIIGCQFEMSFEEFKEKLKPKPIKDDEEILRDVESILKSLEANKDGTI